MNFIEFWFRLTILLRLISVSFAIPRVFHSRIMRSVRTGDVQELEQVIETRPASLKRFKVEYWSMALKSWSIYPDSGDKRRIVTILMNELGDKNEKRMGMTPLICAVKYGHRQSVSDIVRFSNVDGRNNRGQTALIVSIKNGLLEIAEELLDHGADVNICDGKKRSAIHHACLLGDQNKREEAVRLLLGNNADVSVMKCPYAIKYDCIDIDKVLANNLLVTGLNADELIMMRIKMDVENIRLTMASIILLMAFASFFSLIYFGINPCSNL